MNVVRRRVWSCMALAGLLAVAWGCSGSTESVDSASSAAASDLPLEQQIIQAATTGDVGRLEAILAANPKLVNYQGNDRRTPLHFAAAHGQDTAVEYLLSNGADPAAKDEDGLTPQSTAFQQGHPETAKRIGEAAAGGLK